MGQTIARMKQGYSKIRNEALASTFEYMGYIEHWGSGILRVMQQVRDAGLREPEFVGGDTDLRINVYRENANPPSDGEIVTGLRRDSPSGEVRDSARFDAGECAIVRDNAAGVSSQEKRIMELLSDGETLSREQVEKALGVKNGGRRFFLMSL